MQHKIKLDDFAARIADDLALEGLIVKDVLLEYHSLMVEELLNDGVIRINGIGQFSLKDRPEHQRKQMFGEHKGEVVTVKASKLPVFKFSSNFKNDVIHRHKQ